MDYKSKLNRTYEIVRGKLSDVSAWFFPIGSVNNDSDIQAMIDRYENETIGDVIMSEVKRYENNYYYKDGQIHLGKNEDDNIFIFSGKSLRNGCEWWDYNVYDYVNDSDVFISDYENDITYLVKSSEDIRNFLHGNKDGLTVYDKPLDYNV